MARMLSLPPPRHISTLPKLAAQSRSRERPESALPRHRRTGGRSAACTSKLTKRPIMYRRIDPLISASRGTLAGDLLWLGAIGFILAIITGMIG